MLSIYQLPRLHSVMKQSVQNTILSLPHSRARRLRTFCKLIFAIVIIFMNRARVIAKKRGIKYIHIQNASYNSPIVRLSVTIFLIWLLFSKSMWCVRPARKDLLKPNWKKQASSHFLISFQTLRAVTPDWKLIYFFGRCGCISLTNVFPFSPTSSVITS